MTTMLEVTKRAGVLKAAVSRVFFGDSYVSQEIKDRAFQVIEENGYRPNLLVRSLAVKTTQTPGPVVTNTLYHGVYFSGLLFHTAWMAEDKRRQLLLADSKHSAEGGCQAIQYLLDLRCDAIMICPRFLDMDEIDDIIDAHSQPTMVLNRRLWRDSSHSVWYDQEQTGFNAITQLTTAGHKEIGFITGSMDSPTGVERLSGHKDALTHHGIALNNDPIVKGKWTSACGVAGVGILFSRRVSFAALVVSNDDMAIGMMRQLHEYDASAPAQMSVTGFDDTVLTPYTIPAFSSVEIPVTETIQETIGCLISVLGDGAFMPLEIFAGELIARDSVTPPISR